VWASTSRTTSRQTSCRRTSPSTAPSCGFRFRPAGSYFFGNPARRFNETSTIRLCRALLADAGAFVDIGAHVGLYLWSLLPLFGPERPGYFFEPHPELFSLLQANAARLTPHLQGFAAAVDDHDGLTDFHVDTADWSMSTVVSDPRSRHEYRRLRVPCVRFDSFAREVNLRDALVKQISRAERRTFSTAWPRVGRRSAISCARCWKTLFSAVSVSEAAKTLRADAYLIGDGLLVPSASVSRWNRTDRNWLFTRRPRSVLESVIGKSRLYIAQSR
jgi:FkbM family methyltransferase